MEDSYTKHEYVLDLKEGPTSFTSIVCSEEEFESLLDGMTSRSRIRMVDTGERMMDEHVENFRRAKYIPLVARGSITEWMFTRYDTQAKLMAVVVRGYGPKMALDNMHRFTN